MLPNPPSTSRASMLCSLRTWPSLWHCEVTIAFLLGTKGFSEQDRGYVERFLRVFVEGMVFKKMLVLYLQNRPSSLSLRIGLFYSSFPLIILASNLCETRPQHPCLWTPTVYLTEHQAPWLLCGLASSHQQLDNQNLCWAKHQCPHTRSHLFLGSCKGTSSCQFFLPGETGSQATAEGEMLPSATQVWRRKTLQEIKAQGRCNNENHPAGRNKKLHQFQEQAASGAAARLAQVQEACRRRQRGRRGLVVEEMWQSGKRERG